MKKDNQSNAATLRQKAEELLKEKQLKADSLLSDAETQKLIHELGVHQIELELQNEELMLAKEQAEVASEKYVELYDFAPSGYFTLSPVGEIIELNLSGANMLGKDRSQLTNSLFDFFVSYDTKPTFNLFLEKVFKSKAKESCEVALSTNGNSPIYVQLTGIADQNGQQCLISATDISQRKQAEEELLESSEERFRLLYENAKTGLYRTTPDGTILLANKALVTMLGYQSFDELAKKNVEQDGFETPHQRKAFLEKIEQNGEVDNLESTWLRLDGSPVFVRESARAIRDSNGNTLYYDGTVEDITERKKSENALRESEKKLKTIFDLVPVGITVLDEDHNIIEANPAIEKILDISKDDLLNRAYRSRSYLRADHTPMPAEEYASARALKEQRPVNNVVTGVVKEDGNVIWTDVSAVPVSFLNWKVVLVTSDITELKQAEEALHESEARYRLLFEQSADGILIADIETKTFNYANPALCRMLGYTEEELKTLGLADIHPEQDLLRVVAEFESQTHGDKVLAPDIPCLRKDGSIVFADINTTAITMDGRKCAVGLFRDITERKLAEEEKEKLTMQLKERVKEIRCLYSIASIIEVPNIEIGEMFKKIVEVMPSGWQYPDITCARITIGKDEYKTDNYKETKWKQASDVTINGMKAGCIEVFYLEEKAEIDEGPFLEEERSLIKAIAEHLGNITGRKRAEELLKSSEEQYRILFENVPIGIGVSDLTGKLIAFNDAMLKPGGYSSDDINGIGNVENLYYNLSDRKEVISLMKEKGFVNQHPIKFKRKDGSSYDTLLSLSIIHFKDQPRIQALVEDITERKQAEEALQHERTLLRTIIDLIPDAIFAKDIEGRKTLSNLREVQFTGKNSEAEIIGKTDFDLYPESVAKHSWDEDKLIIQSGKPILDIESSLIDKDGQVHWQLGSKVPLLDIHGHITGIVGFSHDTTKSKQAEAILRDSEKKYRLLIETVNEGILVAQNGFLKFVNPMMQVITGFTQEELLTLPFINYVYPEDREIVISNHLKRLKGEQFVSRYQFRIVKKDGSIRRIEMNGIIIEWEGQSATLDMLTDITERMQAEEALRNSEQRYRLLVETANEGILVAQNGFHKFVNSMMQEITGFTKEELLSLPFIDNVYPDDLELVKSNHLKRLKGDLDVPKYQYRFVKKDGSIRWIEMNGIKIEWEGQPATLNMLTDITERVQAEEEIRLKNEQLLKLNAEKDKFFSIISHDLRGPFSGFLGLTEIMAEDLLSFTMDEIQEFSVNMRNSATNLYRLLENLLQWSRMQQGSIPFNPELLQLLQVVDECITMEIEQAKNKGIEITHKIPDDLMVFADSNMLQTVIRNLVSNALKFTPKGGKISVSAKTTGDKGVEISVKDTGIGMTSEMINNLFRLDVKTNREGTDGEPSSGLGLLLCKEFVEKPGGKIRVESEVGNGSTFYFTIPKHI